MANDDIKYPPGFGLNDVVGWGTTGLVVLDKPAGQVIKTPLDPEDTDMISREQHIYERFTERGSHDGLLRYFGTFECGIRLEYASNHHLRSVNKQDHITDEQRLSWAAQIAEALDFVHDAGVIHGDLTCANIFLDGGFNAKLADFAGSSLDGSPLLVAVTASHEFPGSVLSVQGDIFAFGCLLYEIMTGRVPYEGKDDDEILELYTKGDFPDTSSSGAVGCIIRRCWLGEYVTTKELVRDLRRTSTGHELKTPGPSYQMPWPLTAPTLICIGMLATAIAIYSRWSARSR